MAEGGGFEPPKGIAPFNDLANRRLQPLSHPSAGSLNFLSVLLHAICNLVIRNHKKYFQFFQCNIDNKTLYVKYRFIER